jgi:hypothetical protein
MKRLIENIILLASCTVLLAGSWDIYSDHKAKGLLEAKEKWISNNFDRIQNIASNHCLQVFRTMDPSVCVKSTSVESLAKGIEELIKLSPPCGFSPVLVTNCWTTNHYYLSSGQEIMIECVSKNLKCKAHENRTIAITTHH